MPERNRLKRTIGSKSKKEGRVERLESKSKETKWKKVPLSKARKRNLKAVGWKTKHATAIKPTGGAKRAKRTLGRIKGREERREKRT